MEVKSNIKNNTERFSGFADHYDKFRPVPPSIITEILINYIGKNPSVVVDLGCGTGLSTFIWQDYSDKIIGIDPNIDMLNKAKEKYNKNNGADNVILQLGYGNDTKLKSNSVDIVTCSSSFQWMEPKSTIKEVSRILVEDGIFAMYNHDQPPTIDWVVEKAYKDLFNKIYQILDNSQENEGKVKLWNINEYLETMKESNKFRFIREILIHSKVTMDADDFIGFAFSQGALQDIIKKNCHTMNNEINKFVCLVNERLGNKVFDATFSYRMRIGIR